MNKGLTGMYYLYWYAREIDGGGSSIELQSKSESEFYTDPQELGARQRQIMGPATLQIFDAFLSF